MSPPTLPAEHLVPRVLDGQVGPGSQGRHGPLEHLQERSITLSTLTDTESSFN
jgi:hypothetical protein